MLPRPLRASACLDSPKSHAGPSIRCRVRPPRLSSDLSSKCTRNRWLRVGRARPIRREAKRHLIARAERADAEEQRRSRQRGSMSERPCSVYPPPTLRGNKSRAMVSWHRSASEPRRVMGASQSHQLREQANALHPAQASISAQTTPPEPQGHTQLEDLLLGQVVLREFFAS